MMFSEAIQLRMKLKWRLVHSILVLNNKHPVKTPNQIHSGRGEVLKVIDDYTTGRVHVGMSTVTFEDERDAVMFSLGYKE